MRHRLRARPRLARRAALASIAAIVCLGIFAAAAPAKFQADSVVPVFCTSDTIPANNMGNFAKYSTPVVANGKVYVGTFSNKVVQYGL